MRFLFFVGFILLTSISYSQKKAKYTLYKMGRPENFERNNAIRDVQSKWKIDFVSISGSGIYSENLDSLILENKKTELVLKIKLGNEWRNQFNQEVQERLQLHSIVRELIKSNNDSLLAIKEMQIAVEMKRKRKATVIVFGRDKWNGENKFITFYRYKVIPKKKKIRLLSSKKELINFSYSENGIENK